MTDAIPVYPERCKFCNCELPKLNPNFDPECNTCRFALILGLRVVRKHYPSFLEDPMGESIAWRLGEYVWSYETARLERDRLFRKAAMREIDIQELARDLQKKLTEIVSNATAEDEECPGSGNITAILGVAEDALARIREEFPK